MPQWKFIVYVDTALRSMFLLKYLCLNNAGYIKIRSKVIEVQSKIKYSDTGFITKELVQISEVFRSITYSRDTHLYRQIWNKMYKTGVYV